MNRRYYQELAEQGLRMPIGADLVLHRQANPEAVRQDGPALGRVVIETARRFETPLAVPLMDLQLEKAALLAGLGMPAGQAATFHFSEPPAEAQMQALLAGLEQPLPPRLQAHVDAVAHVARHAPDLVPCGMAIGPFSLMTKLLADPITPVYLSGAGMTAADDPSVACLDRALELAIGMVERSIRAQLDAGARIVCLAEPAANQVYLSPKQLAEGSDVFDRLVMVNLRRVARLLKDRGADLFFHCCGELTDDMLVAYGSLDPALLSLGSSRPLWDVAPLVPERTVLFGNLPSKQFYSDAVITEEGVRARALELVARMKAIGRPFILGSECDVLSVKGCEETILRKVDAFLSVGRGAAAQVKGAAA